MKPAGRAIRCIGLGTDADPIDPVRGPLRAVRFHRDLEARPVQRGDQRRVQLQQGFAACADYKIRIADPASPQGGYMPGQRVGILKPAAAIPIHAYEVSVAETADGAGSVTFEAAPEIAPREPQEDRGPPSLAALALNGEEGFLDGVGH